jgi:transposase
VADRHCVSRSLLFEWRRQLREGSLAGVSRADATPLKAFAPVRVIENGAATRAAISTSSSPRAAARPRAPVPIVELLLRNGRVLRIAETMAPELLGRMAAALDGEC